jgi:hypothetical protein
MIILADEGDENRMDKSCGVLYGLIRDTAYKIRSLAEKEKNIHISSGLWDNERMESQDYEKDETKYF